MYLKATPALAQRLVRTVEVVAYAGGYAGVQLVAPEVINLCLVIGKAPLRTLGGDWSALAARLAQESALAPLLDADPLLARPLTISGVPYGYLRRATPSDAAYCVGDQAAVIPSFCGDGMAIAIHSGVQVADALVNRMSPARFHAELRVATSGPVRRAMRFQRILRTPWGRSALLLGFAGIPGMIQLIARATRITPPTDRPGGTGVRLSGYS
jgi:flavin-dependent dehydrogenase